MSNRATATGAIEITTFMLAGFSCEQFIAANKDVDAFLKRQPGFQSRRIAEQADGSILDMLIWDSEQEGTAAMHGLMRELSDSPVHGMIDQETVSWNIVPVSYHFQ